VLRFKIRTARRRARWLCAPKFMVYLTEFSTFDHMRAQTYYALSMRGGMQPAFSRWKMVCSVGFSHAVGAPVRYWRDVGMELHVSVNIIDPHMRYIEFEILRQEGCCRYRFRAKGHVRCRVIARVACVTNDGFESI